MESISRISSLLETARDLTLEAAKDVGPRRPIRPLPAAQIKKLLDSRAEREVLDGLRRIIAMQYASPPLPALQFFPAVLKTLSTPFPSTRPLVYNYLLHHAEADPDTTLLSINTIQKTLSDTNPRVRAMALKTLSGIRVPMISQLVSLAIKKGVSDLSPLVRKAAALACIKCVRLDAGTRPQVEEYLAKLLADQQYFVVGAAVQAFVAVCGMERMEMVHPVYRKLCRMMVDMDEWGQLAVLRLMVSYARGSFPRRTKRVRKTVATREEKAKDFYEDLDAPKEQKEDELDDTTFEDVEVLDSDLELLLSSARPLLQSRNSAVIIAVTRLYLYLSPATHLPLAVSSLIALLRSPADIQQIALANIVQITIQNPSLLAPYTRHFLLRATDPPSTNLLKLDLLTLLFPHTPSSTQSLLLAELSHFASSPSSPDLVRASVRALGRCAQASDPSTQTSRACLSLLQGQLHSPDPVLAGEAMQVIRHLIQRAPERHVRTIIRLAKNLDSLTSSAARASVVWLVGEYASQEGGEGREEGIAADVWRILLKGYADESDEVRTQIVLLGAKCYLHYLNANNAKRRAIEALNSPNNGEQHQSESHVLSPPLETGGFGDLEPEGKSPDGAESGEAEAQEDTIPLLWSHTQLLARYTPSYDLRDRARVLRSLLAIPTSIDLASLLLLAPKPVPQVLSPGEGSRCMVFGGIGVVVGESWRQKDSEEIPEWVAHGEEPDSRLREDGAAVGAGKTAVSAGTVLDEALEVEVERTGGFGVGGGKGAGREKSLDAWLDEEEDEEEDSEGSSEYETETESEEGEDESASESGEQSESESEEDERAGLVR